MAESYFKSLPPISEELRRVTTHGQAEQVTRKLVYATVDPWTVFCAAKPGRDIPGWTKSLDWNAKQQSMLIRSVWSTAQRAG